MCLAVKVVNMKLTKPRDMRLMNGKHAEYLRTYMKLLNFAIPYYM
jgi:hypothetical protein